MSKAVTYICDLCRNETSVDDLRGIEFTGGYKCRTFVFRNPKDTNTHLCDSCKEMIIQLHGEESVTAERAIAP